MNSELEVLKKIWENKEETYVKLISGQTGFGIDYTRYLCNCLFKKGEIKPVKNKRDWYKITSKGKRELKLRGLIKLKKKKISKRKSLVWPTLKLRDYNPPAALPPKGQAPFPKNTKSFLKKTKLISSPAGFQEKLKISKEVERAASSLEKLKV